MSDRPMSQAEVFSVLGHLEGFEAVVVGGQSIALWCRHLGVPEDETPTSRDVDFLAGRAAAEALAKAVGGEVRIPAPDDASPNSAVVTVAMDGRIVTVDFLHSVLGVPEADLRRGAVRLASPDGTGPELIIMNPVDCLRSRIANALVLRRVDDHAARQARAAVRICGAFADRLLSLGHRRSAQDALLDAAWLARRAAGTSFAGLLPEGAGIADVTGVFLSDDRLDPRWRAGRLAPALDRAASRTERMASRGSAGPSCSPAV